jgi:hypothetical protein
MSLSASSAHYSYHRAQICHTLCLAYLCHGSDIVEFVEADGIKASTSNDNEKKARHAQEHKSGAVSPVMLWRPHTNKLVPSERKRRKYLLGGLALSRRASRLQRRGKNRGRDPPSPSV